MVVKHEPICKGLDSTSVRSRLASTPAVHQRRKVPAAWLPLPWVPVTPFPSHNPPKNGRSQLPTVALLWVHSCFWLSLGEETLALQPPPLNRLRQIVSFWDLGGTKGGRQVCLWLYAHSKVQCHPSRHFQFPSFAPTADNLFHFLSSLLYALSVLYSFQKAQAIGWNPRISLQVTCQGIFHSQVFCPSVTLVIKNVFRWYSVRLILESPTV